MKTVKITTLFIYGVFLLFTHTSPAAMALCSCSEISTDLEISALYPNPLDGEEEWIEITNTGSEVTQLSYYTIEDETNKPFSLIGSIEADETVRVIDFGFALNNGGDSVYLKGLDGSLIDEFTYTSSSAGEILSANSNSEETTEGQTNEEVQEDNSISTPTLWPDFSEALPNPEGSDSTDEWIELYNPYDQVIQLDGLYLDDQAGGSSPHVLSGNMSPFAYKLIMIDESHLTLNNSFDAVRLLGNEEELLWEVNYDDPTEGESYAVIDGTGQWTNNPTPGTENEMRTEEGSEESNYQDGDLSEDVELTEVFPNPEGADQDNEWIEITNGGDEAVNLGNWQIDDGEGGSSPYTFPDETLIEPGETLVIPRPLSKLALNNSNETVQLFDFTGEVMDEIFYSQSQEGKAYAKIKVESTKSFHASLSEEDQSIQTNWEWVSPSPGLLNPYWQSIEGNVLSFDDGHLQIDDGLSTWVIEAAINPLNETFFQVGNLVKLQISQIEGTYQVMKSELIQSYSSPEKTPIPYNAIGSLLIISSWAFYQWHKKRQEKRILPSSQLR